jgi:hypothetical protein
MNFFVGAFYDGIILYGMALNASLDQGDDPQDGLQLTRQYIWDRDFIGQLCYLT